MLLIPFLDIKVGRCELHLGAGEREEAIRQLVEARGVINDTIIRIEASQEKINEEGHLEII